MTWKISVPLFGLTMAAMLAAAPPVSAQGFTVDDDLANRGRDLYYSKGCNACHEMGKKGAGPDLIGLLERRDREWLDEWLSDTPGMLEYDSIAIAMMDEYNGVRMPDMRLRARQIDALLHYIAKETQDRSGS